MAYWPENFMGPKPGAEIWYRYNDVSYSTGYDETRDCSSGSVLKIELREYEVLRRTPKGAWINGGGSFSTCGERFVLLSARKRFACPTKEEAMESFMARKKAQARIYTGRLQRAMSALSLASDLVVNG